MARQYYYLIASLPNLIFEQEAKNFDFLQLKQLVRESVHPSDYRWVEILFTPIDNQNVLNFKLHEHLPFADNGRYTTEEEFKTDIENSNNLPKYITSFLANFDKPEGNAADEVENDENKSTIEIEQQLFQGFYAYAEKNGNKFIRQWFTFDRELRNIQAAFVARKIGSSVKEFLIGSDDITEQLIKSNSTDFGLRRERDYIDKLWQALDTKDIMERERKLDILRWQYLDEITTFNYFDINVVLAFLQKASIIDRWLKLDTETGIAMFEQLVTELKESYDAEEAFKKDIN